jgi:TonB family protein
MQRRTFNRMTALLVLTVLTAAVGSAGAADDAADSSKGPPGKPRGGRDYYPWKARLHGVTGRVGLEYSVDQAGHAHSVVVVESGGTLLDSGAVELLDDIQFKVPADWTSSGGPTRRFSYGVIFQLEGKPAVPRFEDKRQTMTITSRAGGP